MKKTILLFMGLCFTVISQAQVTTTIDILPQYLGKNLSVLCDVDITTVNKLIIKGTITASQFANIRDNMPVLTQLDLSNATIASYTGTLGTSGTYMQGSKTYLANAIPPKAFIGKTKLTSIKLPSSVTSIGDSSFFNCINLTSITIPSQVNSIGERAFLGCTSLTSVIIPPLVSSIGSNAFKDCSSLDSVDIQSSISTIADYTFYNCTALKKVTIPSSVTTIGASVFKGCSSLSSVTIPNSVTYLGGVAFFGCTSLTSINIPSSVTQIGFNAFSKSSTYITVADSNPNYTSIEGVLFDKAQTTLIHCPTTKVGNYIIPSSVTSIKDYAFSDCSSLTGTLTIPPSVVYIGDYSFKDCSGLTGTLTIPPSVVSIGGESFSGCSGLTGDLIIPSSITTISANFNSCPGFTSITFPSSMINSVNSFNGCSNLKSIYVHSKIPCDLYPVTFGNMDKTSCVLHVPVGSKAAYKSAIIWKEFLNIVEYIPTGEKNTSISTLQIKVQNGQLRITGVPINEKITVYNMQGVCVYSHEIFADEVSFRLPVHGVYVVRVGVERIKVIY